MARVLKQNSSLITTYFCPGGVRQANPSWWETQFWFASRVQCSPIAFHLSNTAKASQPPEHCALLHALCYMFYTLEYLRNYKLKTNMGVSIIPAFWPYLPPGVSAVVLESELLSYLPSLPHSLSAPFSPTPPSLFFPAIHIWNISTSKISLHAERSALLNMTHFTCLNNNKPPQGGSRSDLYNIKYTFLRLDLCR